MSSDLSRADVIEAVGHLVMRWQDATERFDERVGELYALGAAERHCLGLLWRGPQPGSVIAKEIGLVPASVTALVDRLERRGYVQRRSDSSDRRKVLIALTDKSDALIRETYLPLAAAGRRKLSNYSDSELAAIMKFLQDALKIQERAILTLSKNAAAKPSTTRSKRDVG